MERWRRWILGWRIRYEWPPELLNPSGRAIIAVLFTQDVRYTEVSWSWYDADNGIIHFFTYAPYIRFTSFTAATDLFFRSLHTRRGIPVPQFEPGPTLGNLTKLKEYQRQVDLVDCRARASSNFDKAMMANLNDAISLRKVDPIDFASGVGNNAVYSNEINKTTIKGATANTVTGVLLSKEVRAYWNLITAIDSQYGADLANCERQFGK